MIGLFFNGLAASAGGGLTYLRNVIPHLSARCDVRITVAVTSVLRRELNDLPNVSFADLDLSANVARRFWQEQTLLPNLIRHYDASVLISAGNFALRNSPVPQILLSRNSLYTSDDFFRDLRLRRDYALWLDTRIKSALAKRSIFWADVTVPPSQAFAAELSRWTGRPVSCIAHGFDHDAFFRDSSLLPEELEQKIRRTDGSLRLLFVSHYNYYRNFETLLRAIPILSERLGSRKVQAFFTCKFQSAENPGSYRAGRAAALIRELGIAKNIVELGTVPYPQLHRIYRACDVYVSPAYAESFAHPMVEAMASGLPIAASDLAVHREICGAAALYFPRFSPDEIATTVLRAISPETMQTLSEAGRKRSLNYSWERHVDQLLQLACHLAEKRKPSLPA